MSQKVYINVYMVDNMPFAGNRSYIATVLTAVAFLPVHLQAYVLLRFYIRHNQPDRKRQLALGMGAWILSGVWPLISISLTFPGLRETTSLAGGAIYGLQVLIVLGIAGRNIWLLKGQVMEVPDL